MKTGILITASADGSHSITAPLYTVSTVEQKGDHTLLTGEGQSTSRRWIRNLVSRLQREHNIEDAHVIER